MHNFVLAALLLLRYSSLEIQAFGGKQFLLKPRQIRSGSSSHYFDQSRTTSSSSWNGVHHAKVFDEGVYTDLLDEDDSEEGSQDNSFYGNVKEKELLAWLSRKCDTPLLTRLACAHAPPPHSNMHPKRIDSAHLVRVDGSSMDIAVAIGPIQILVTVPYPNPCNLIAHDEQGHINDSASSSDAHHEKLSPERSVEECISMNLEWLDLEAHKILVQREWEEDYSDVISERQSRVQVLQEEPRGDELPDWWTYPGLNQFLAAECTSLKALLNEDDFSDDLIALASSASLCQPHHQSGRQTVNGQKMKIVKACAACVGPSGLVLRAQVEIEAPAGDIPDADSSGPTVMEFPIQFKNVASSADELQLQVLDLVESISSPADSNPPEEVESSSHESFENESKSIRIQSDETILAAHEIEVQLDNVAKIEDEREEDDPSLVSKVRSEHGAASFDEDLLERHINGRYDTITASSQSPSLSPLSVLLDERFIDARRQPKSASEEAKLAAKYAALESLSERAFQILVDLGMVCETRNVDQEA